MFKFVVKSEALHLETLKSYFNGKQAEFFEKLSSKNTFTSLTIKVKMKSADAVISIYKKVSLLEGIMALLLLNKVVAIQLNLLICRIILLH